ncbi:MAG: HAD-IA family hydrolase [Prolixibacteraceae bacterium]|nr:HAD-IA family hydrolase [Prolixibacteraceae bacterium]
MQKKLTVNPDTRALIFDIDGTLADTMPTHYRAFQNVLGRYGIQFSWDYFLKFAGIPVGPQMVKFKAFFKPDNFDPERVAIEKEDEYFRMIETTKPVDVVFKVFNDYAGKLPIGCATGGDRRIATRTLEVLGITDKIDALVTCDDVKNGKPAPDTFLKCAQLLGVEPRFCHVFEDGVPGIEGAKAAGMMVTDIREFL